MWPQSYGSSGIKELQPISDLVGGARGSIQVPERPGRAVRRRWLGIQTRPLLNIMFDFC